jgi:AcrR family transcriptional regulator
MSPVKFDIDRASAIPVGAHPLPAQEVAEHQRERLLHQRERLLQAMASCTSELGYQATTVGDVVRVARTSRSAFYEHFTDKQECFLEVYRELTSAFIGAAIEAAAKVDSWQEKLEIGIATYFQWMAEHPEVARSTIIEIHEAGREGLEERGKALSAWMRTIEGVAILARRAGERLPQLDEVAYAAIILTSEAYVHDYARRGCVARVTEKTAAVQSLARVLFEHGVGPR